MPVSADDHPMAADSATSAASQTNTSPLTGPSSLGSAFDAQGLPTVHEVAHYKTHHDFNSMDHRLRSPMRRPSGGSGTGSRNGSAGSSVGRSFDDKLLEAPPLPYGNTSQVSATPVSHPSFEETPRRSTMPNGNGYGNGHSQDPPKQSGEGHHRRLSKANAARREKRGGIRNTIRRILGIQRSPKDRISMPTPAVYSRHNPEEFITSATDVDDATPQRSASVPANAVPRRSALNSHPPSTRHTVVKDAAVVNEPQQPTTPPKPERRAPERPRRPRSASVPSVLIQDMQAMEAAMATNVNVLDKEGPNLQDVEAQNIGFAVTNGSNPKRRSRSVGAFPSGDHRMSPIQWHHIRRRSDEIRYWRESTQLSSFGGLKIMGSPEALSPVLAKGDIEDPAGETADENADETRLGEHNEQFNFGLPAETLQMQNQESMGLEERLITLEIKLMDFEYALSKLQAGSTSSRRHSQVETAKRQQSMDSYRYSDAPQTSVEASPAIPQGPISRSISHKPSVEDLMNPKPRPTSVATTIKQGAHSGIHTSSEKPPSADRSGGMHSSLTNLTIEHYTTLIALIRHEQLARQRLEEQITSMQEQLDRQALSSFSQQQQRTNDYHPSTHHHQHHPSSSQHSHTFSSSQSSSRRHGMIDTEQPQSQSQPQQQPPLQQQHSQSRRRGLGVGGAAGTYPNNQQQQQQQQQQPPLLRPRSSSYSTNATTTTTDDDTDDDYHDVYVTAEPTPVMDHQPTERGEYERGAFDRITVGEGVAF